MGRGKIKGLIITILFVGIASCVYSQFVPTYKTKHLFSPRVTGVNTKNSDKVTRVRCEIMGVPNTSDRIDEVKLIHGGMNIAATDIDGVDFKRYFQWEDEGIVEIEIDFPLQGKISPNDTLSFETVHGICKIAVKNILEY